MNNYKTCTIQITGCTPVSNYPVNQCVLDKIYYASMILDIDVVNRFSEVDYIKEIVSKSKHIPENIKLSIINSYFRIFIIVERSIEEMLSISKRVNLEERMFEVLKTLEYIDLQTERSDNVYLGVLD